MLSDHQRDSTRSLLNHKASQHEVQSHRRSNCCQNELHESKTTAAVQQYNIGELIDRSQLSQHNHSITGHCLFADQTDSTNLSGRTYSSLPLRDGAGQCSTSLQVDGIDNTYLTTAAITTAIGGALRNGQHRQGVRRSRSRPAYDSWCNQGAAVGRRGCWPFTGQSGYSSTTEHEVQGVHQLYCCCRKRWRTGGGMEDWHSRTDDSAVSLLTNSTPSPSTVRDEYSNYGVLTKPMRTALFPQRSPQSLRNSMNVDFGECDSCQQWHDPQHRSTAIESRCMHHDVRSHTAPFRLPSTCIPPTAMNDCMALTSSSTRLHCSDTDCINYSNAFNEKHYIHNGSSSSACIYSSSGGGIENTDGQCGWSRGTAPLTIFQQQSLHDSKQRRPHDSNQDLLTTSLVNSECTSQSPSLHFYHESNKSSVRRRRSANNNRGRGSRDAPRVAMSGAATSRAVTGGKDEDTNNDDVPADDQQEDDFTFTPGADRERDGVGKDLWGGIPRSELVLLLLQTLSSLGFEQSRQMLEGESNMHLESEIQTAVHHAILAADLPEASRLLGQLGMPEELKQQCDFQLQLFKYTQHLQRGEIKAAVSCLRNELTELCDIESDTATFSKYCGWLLATSQKDLRILIEEDSCQPFTTEQLWKSIVSYLAPSYATAQDRLAVLLRQALELQEYKCVYHRRLGCVPASSDRSLLRDHECTKFDIKSEIIGRLINQKDEILHVAASHSGKYLAAGSKDGTVAFYSTRPPKFRLITELQGHKDSVTEVAWNKIDTMLLSISSDNNIRIWSVDPPGEASLLRQVTNESCRTDTKYITTAGARWLPNNHQIVYHWGIRKVYLSNKVTDFRANFEQYRWKLNSVVRDAVVTFDGSMLALLEANESIRAIDLETKSKLFYFSETSPVICLSSSSIKRRLLTSCTGTKPVIRLWNLDAQTADCTYIGHSQRRFVVRPIFAGADDAFVICGGEDAKICIWDRLSGALLKILVGHNDSVNAVSWVDARNSQTSFLFSASDDSQVLVWKLSAEQEERSKVRSSRPVTRATHLRATRCLEVQDDVDCCDDVVAPQPTTAALSTDAKESTKESTQHCRERCVSTSSVAQTATTEVDENDDSSIRGQTRTSILCDSYSDDDDIGDEYCSVDGGPADAKVGVDNQVELHDDMAETKVDDDTVCTGGGVQYDDVIVDLGD
eukprot:Lankesteria_metandrocarpae@DN4485_c0_g1_i1.p1